MSLYIAYSPDIKTRRSESIFYFRSKYCFLLKNGKKTSHAFKYEELTIDVYRRVLEYTQKKRLDSYEVVLSSNVDLRFLLSYLSNYLLNKDISIGLITSNSTFINRNKNILFSYGVTCSGISYKPKYNDNIRYSLMMPSFHDEDIKARPIKKIASKGPIRHPDPLTASLRICSVPNIELDESFHTKFFRFLTESGKENVEIYKKAGVSRQVFSKILSDKNMIPTKLTLISLCIGLELSLKDARELMESAGYSLSKSIMLDVIVMKYIKQEIYDFERINSELDEYGCPLLGWHPRD